MPLPPTPVEPATVPTDEDPRVSGRRQDWRFFCRRTKAAATLEYVIVVGVVLAGLGGALVAFVGDISSAMDSMGTAAGSIDTADPGVGSGK